MGSSVTSALVLLSIGDGLLPATPSYTEAEAAPF